MNPITTKTKLETLKIFIDISEPTSELKANIEAIYNELKERENKEYYFLFGETACKMYHENESLTELIEAIKEEGLEFGIHKYIEGEHLENIMEAADGWNGYAMITKDEYETMQKIEDEL